MRSLTATDPPNRKGKTNTWLTPLEITDALGPFDLDPCGFPGHKTANRLICLPDDGLTSAWSGRIWLNPPYGEFSALWLGRLAEHGNGIALIFARTETRYFQRFARRAHAIGFIESRVKFLDQNFIQSRKGIGPSLLLAYGRENAKALKKFSRCGLVVSPGGI